MKATHPPPEPRRRPAAGALLKGGRPRTAWRWASLAVIVSCLVGGTVRGQPEGQGGDAWRVNFIPYYWGPDLDVSLRLGGLEQRASQDFLEDSWVFQPNVIGMAVGAVRGHWGFLVEGEAMDSDLDFTLDDGRQGTMEMTYQRVNLGLLYQWHQPLYEGSDLFVTPWAGLRYRHYQLRLVDGESQDAGGPDGDVVATGDTHWVDPLAGLRAQWFVTPKWSVSAAGNIDGLEQDQVAWGASTWLKYHMRKEFNFGLGYRYDRFNFGGGSGDNQWLADGTGQGIIVALELDFYMVPSSQDGSWDHLPKITPPERRTEDEAIPAGMTQHDIADPTESDEPGGALSTALDLGHDFVNEKLDFGVEAVDAWMLDDDRPRQSRKKSRFFLAVDTRFVEEADGGHTLAIRPTVDAKLYLPNLEKQIKLALTSNAVDEKPGADPFDREEGLNLGVETDELILRRTKFKLGIRSSLDAYVSLSWRPEWRHAGWRFMPEARAYYRTDKGEGLVASLGMSHAIKDRFRIAYLPSLEDGRETDWKLEWLQNLAVAYIFEGTQEDRHRALSMGISSRGTWNDGARSYRWTPISYRAPLYKKWLYMEVGPEIAWREDDGWEPVPTVRFAVSSLFWGTAER